MNLSQKLSFPVPADSDYHEYIRCSLNSDGELVPTGVNEKALGHLDAPVNNTSSNQPGGRSVGTIYRINSGGSHYAILSGSVSVNDEFVGSADGKIAKVPTVTVTAIEADDETATATAHGLLPGDKVVFTSLTGGTGLTVGTIYYVKTVASADTFTVSATRGGAAVGITVDYTAAVLKRVGAGEGVVLEDGSSGDIIRVCYY